MNAMRYINIFTRMFFLLLCQNTVGGMLECTEPHYLCISEAACLNDFFYAVDENFQEYLLNFPATDFEHEEKIECEIVSSNTTQQLVLRSCKNESSFYPKNNDTIVFYPDNISFLCAFLEKGGDKEAQECITNFSKKVPSFGEINYFKRQKLRIFIRFINKLKALKIKENALINELKKTYHCTELQRFMILLEIQHSTFLTYVRTAYVMLALLYGSFATITIIWNISSVYKYSLLLLQTTIVFYCVKLGYSLTEDHFRQLLHYFHRDSSNFPITFDYFVQSLLSSSKEDFISTNTQRNRSILYITKGLAQQKKKG